MAYDQKESVGRRSAFRRMWIHSFLLFLPALVLAAVLAMQGLLSAMAAFLLVAVLVLYFLLVALSLTEAFSRPIQTLTNVVFSMREGDFSFRARGARSGDALGELAG